MQDKHLSIFVKLVRIQLENFGSMLELWYNYGPLWYNSVCESQYEI